jgi:allophanate hydrolase-like protein
MVRVTSGGAAVAVEVWSVPAEAVSFILVNEPDGLTIGRVRLADGSVVLGVLGELAACEGQKEITAFRGWRAHITTLAGNP